MSAGHWRLVLVLGLAVAAGNLAAPLAAQDQSRARSAILTLDQDALYARTKFGKALIEAAEQEAAALKAENRRIDTELEAEERSLTDRRATMPLTEFRGLADAFDNKVEALRAAQDAKSVALVAKRDGAQQRFIQAIGPIMGDYMVSQGAYAIVNKGAIVVSLGVIDITDEVIAEIDAQLGDGSKVPLAPDVAPQKEDPPVKP